MTDVLNRANGASPGVPGDSGAAPALAGPPPVLAARAVIGRDAGPRPPEDGVEDLLAPDLESGEDEDDLPQRREERALATEPAFIDKLKRRLQGPNKGERVGLCEIWRPVEDAEPDKDGKVPKELVVSFRVVSMHEGAYNSLRERYTTNERSKQYYGAKVPVKFDSTSFRSHLIYQATHPEDKKALWEDLELQRLCKAMTAEDLPERLLWAGEKDQVVETIEQISGFKTGFDGDDIKN